MGILIPIAIVLLLVALPLSISQIVNFVSSSTIIIFTITLVCLGSVMSVFVVSIKHLKSLPVLNISHIAYWLLILGGLVVVSISLLAQYLPDSTHYDGLGSFYDELRSYAMGIPLIVPALHVLLSAYIYEKR